MLQKAELSAEADSENNPGGSSKTMYYSRCWWRRPGWHPVTVRS